ncbi:MAG: HutD family protein [Alphaproteobacteria bacterium]
MEHAKPAIVRFGDLAPRPWPNGRGVTRDVANETAGDGSRDWLISIAELVEDAAFSHYEGCDRIFTLVGKNPVDLKIDDLPPLRCNPLVPAHFPGDRPTHCTLAGGPSRAFNLIFNRARMVGAVTSLTIAGHHQAEVPRRPAAVHCAAGTIMVQSETLEAGDTLVAPQERLFRTGETAATLLIVDL